jgi:hypothetical protein
MDRDGDTHKKAQRLVKDGPLQFLQGKLSRDHMGRWAIDGVNVCFTPQSQLLSAARPDDRVSLREGRNVFLMGQRRGNSFVVRRGVVMDQSLLPTSALSTRSPNSEERIVRSPEEPQVGWGDGPK